MSYGPTLNEEPTWPFILTMGGSVLAVLSIMINAGERAGILFPVGVILAAYGLWYQGNVNGEKDKLLVGWETENLETVKIGESFGAYRFKGFLGQNKTVSGSPRWTTEIMTYHTPIIEFGGEDFYVSSKGFVDFGGGEFSVRKKSVSKNEIKIYRGLTSLEME